MKKTLACLMIAMLVLLAVAPATSAGSGDGGPMGFFIGCCFGIRSGAAFNDGKDLHWREWGTLIPVVVAIMNGLDGMNGLTTKDMAAQYGANFY